MAAQVKTPAHFRQGLTIDQLGTRLGQRTFAKLGELLIEFAGQDELEDGIAQEFKALIVLDGHALFMRHRRVRERKLEQAGIFENIAQAILQVLVHASER